MSIAAKGTPTAVRNPGDQTMLMKAAINGTRTRADHPAIPITPAQQAVEAAAAVAAGAGAIHTHVHAADGRESMAPDDVAAVLNAVRDACPGTPVGISTGAWIVPDVPRRLAVIKAWEVLPDFASVNVHEPGALEVCGLLLDRGIGVEAGVWTPHAAAILLQSGLTGNCLRLLLEPAEVAGDAASNLAQVEAVLGNSGPARLLHGLDAWAWEFVALAAERGYDTRTGFEDTLILPNGAPAESNAALVAAAWHIVTSR